MTESWEEFLKKVENPSPGEAVVNATIAWFKDKLQVAHPSLAEGYSEDQIATQLPSELPVQACIKRVLRAVESIAQARRMVQASGAATTAASMPTTSAQSLAKLLVPTKTADVAALLQKASLDNLSFGLQAEQALWNSMQQHAENSKSSSRTPFLYVDLTAKETLPMWLTPDLIGGKFQMHEEGEWPLQGNVPIASLNDLGKALKSAIASPRFFRTSSQAFLRYAVVAVATSQLSWQSVLTHMDIVLQLVEQERMKGNPPFVAFLYDELLRKSWARRAEKGDPALDIPAEVKKVDKDILDIARHRLTEVMKATGLSEGAGASRGSPPSSASDDAMSKQLAVSQMAQKQAERAARQLAETKQLILQQGRTMTAQNQNDEEAPEKLTKKQIKSQKWFSKLKQRREEQASKKKRPWNGNQH